MQLRARSRPTPTPFPAFVAAFETGAHHGASCSVEPLPTLILRAPVTHELEVGDQLPHPCGWEAAMDISTATVGLSRIRIAVCLRFGAV